MEKDQVDSTKQTADEDKVESSSPVDDKPTVTLDREFVEKTIERIKNMDKKQKLYLVGGSGFIFLWLAVGYGAQLLCNAIGFAYPAYESIKAIESRDKDDDTKWLTYWVVFASFSVFEFFSDIFLDWFPFYWLLKCIFLVWCFIPIKSNGSNVIYHRIIQPFFLKNQAKLDDVVQNVKGTVSELAKTAVSKAAEQSTKQD